MAVNLVRNYTPEQARHLLNSSFAQFLADRNVVSLERDRAQHLATLDGYRRNLTCELGDFDAYWALRSNADRLRQEDRQGRERARAQAVRDAVRALRPGDVIHVPQARRRGLAVVVSSRDGKPTMLTQDRSYFRLSSGDLEDPPAVITRMPLPRSGSSRSARYRRDVASRLSSLSVKVPRPPRHRTDPRVERAAAKLEAQAEAHPCHSCPDLTAHVRWAVRADAVRAKLEQTERRIRVRTETLARQFDRVLSVLEELGHVEGWALTPKGRILTRIYGEGDVLVAEALAAGVWEDLEPAEAASLISTVVYEARERVPLTGRLPTPESEERFELMRRIWRRVRRTEDEHQVQLCRDLEAGFATPVFHWAEGKPLEDVLQETEMAPGDFVRNCKQLLDLLRQIADVAPPETARLARRGRDAVLRGVVAYTGL
jgi:ATP-dependent RNA helicase HelY